MKKCILLLLLPLLPFGGFSQQVYHNTYRDALMLAELYNKANAHPSTKDAIKLAAKFDSIINCYSKDSAISNPIISDELRVYPPLIAKTNLEDTTRALEVSIQSPRHTISPANNVEVKQSAYWEEAAITGLADFMAGRFQQEMIHYGLKNVFNKISEDSNVIKTLFKDTHKEVEKLNARNSYYSADLIYLRQLIRMDLDQIPHRMIEDIDSAFPKFNPQAKDLFKLGYSVYGYTQQGKNLPDLLDALPSGKYGPDMIRLLKLVSLFSHALQDTVGTKQRWVDPSRLTGDLGKKNLVPTYFFGLLYEQLKNDNDLDTILKKITAGYPNMEGEYYKDIIPVMKGFMEFSQATNYLNNSGNAPTKENRGIIFIQQVNKSLAKFLETKEVNLLVYNSNENQRKALSAFIKINELFVTKEYATAIPVLINEMGEYFPENNGEYRHSILFITQLVNVSQSEDLKQLLLSYALPVGGSSIKRSSKWNISLNGYVGLTGGLEWAFGSDLTQNRGNIGLTAPVGLSVTPPLIKGNNPTLTVFASFIDLGSVVNIRLNNDTTSFSGLRFEQFITPGIGVFVNCPKLPITIGAMYSYIPNLRTIKYHENNIVLHENNVTVGRLNVSVLIDIPFFTLYNR